MNDFEKITTKLLQRKTNVKLDLSRIQKLLKLLDLGHSNTKIIQVVGTNGKGSTVAFIESVLKANNYSTGLFSSPHLSCIRERIRINGLPISEELFIASASYINKKSKHLDEIPTFFECMLAMALWLFFKHKIEVIILEAGLGGRLDATTACNADILGITTIALDHEHILGNSLEKITEEKIAAARSRQKVISVIQEPCVMKSLAKAQEEKGFDLRWAKRCDKPLALYGAHQEINAGLALALIDNLGLKISSSHTALGLLAVHWPGRFEIIRKDITFVLDGAHNPSGIKVLNDALKDHPELKAYQPLLVFGSLKNSSVEKIALLTQNIAFAHVVVHEPQNPRAEPSTKLKEIFIKNKIEAHRITKFCKWDDVKKRAHDLNTYVLVCGSLYTVGDARAWLLN
jgi:dihydrofolate synthase/folylpolyglutamate synthase